MERYEYLCAAEQRLYTAVPPLDPVPLHWLWSEISCCYSCANKAVLAGENLKVWSNEKVKQEIGDAFDAPSDSPEACDMCSCTLRYTLTDYGLQEELAQFAEYPGFEAVGPEQTYEISRICLNLTRDGAPADQVEAAILIVEAALAALSPKGTDRHD